MKTEPLAEPKREFQERLPRVIVIGPQGNGKTTFSEMLAVAMGTRATDTSAWLIKVETARQEALRERYHFGTVLPSGIPLRENADGTYDLEDGWVLKSGWDEARDRPARELLVALGDAVAKTSPGFLEYLCWKLGAICTGARRQADVEFIRKQNPKAVWIYILRPGYESDVTDNFDIPQEEADITIVNDGTLEDLQKQAERTARHLLKFSR